MLAPDILVPMMLYGAPHVPRTSIVNAIDTTGCRQMTDASDVRLLPFHRTFPSKPGIQNTKIGNNMPRDSAPHMYQVDTGRKDQGRTLLDGGSTPPPYDEDDPTAIGTMAPVISKDKGTCTAPGK
jgi:hypothetical protein